MKIKAPKERLKKYNAIGKLDRKKRSKIPAKQTLVETATRHNVLPGSVADWKKDFLENTDIVFAKDKACKDLRDQLKEKDKEQEQLYKQIGKLTTQLEWAKKKFEEYELKY